LTVTPDRVRELARTPEGSRAVQQSLEQACSDCERREIALQFRGNVSTAVRCPHANFVLQKCVSALRSQDAQFIIDELTNKEDLFNLARHKFGCRLLQRLLEHCRGDQISGLGDILVSRAMPLCRHSYGNYVIQHLLIYGSDDHKRKLVKVFIKQIDKICADMTSLRVLSTAFDVCDDEQRLALALAVYNSDLLISLANKRRGHQVVKAALDAFPVENMEYGNARTQLLSANEPLCRTRYGRSVLRHCEGEEQSMEGDADCSPSKSDVQ